MNSFDFTSARRGLEAASSEFLTRMTFWMAGQALHSLAQQSHSARSSPSALPGIVSDETLRLQPLENAPRISLRAGLNRPQYELWILRRLVRIVESGEPSTLSSARLGIHPSHIPRLVHIERRVDKYFNEVVGSDHQADRVTSRPKRADRGADRAVLPVEQKRVHSGGRG